MSLLDHFQEIGFSILRRMKPIVPLGLIRGHTFLFEAYYPDGSLKWRDGFENLVVNEGLDHNLDVYYRSTAFTSSNFILLTDGSPTFAPTDTMASHPGWTEVTAYDETPRPTLTMNPASGQQMDNEGNRAVYTINADATIVGGGAISNDSTKGGATGILVGGNALSKGDKSLDISETIAVKVIATAASS